MGGALKESARSLEADYVPQGSMCQGQRQDRSSVRETAVISHVVGKQGGKK